jgi:predicted phage-related endonuclease
VFESKTTNAYNANDWDDSIPDAYVLQTQHYLAVTGFKGCYIAVLIGGNTFKWKFIERDEAMISMLVKLEADFWAHVQSNTPPPLDGTEASVNFIKEMFPNSVPATKVELPNEAADIILQYVTACELVEQHTERKELATNLLKQMLGNNEVGVLGDMVVTWKSISQERLDTKTLKVEHPNLYKKYTNTTSYRRFSIK